MKDRPRIQRALLRRALRQQMRRGDGEASQLIGLTLDDEAVFETFYESAMQDAKLFGESTGVLSVATNAAGEPVVDNLLKLLQWFVTNGPQLIALIEKIIGMFGSIQMAVELYSDEMLFVD